MNGDDDGADDGDGSGRALSARFEANREHWESMVEPVSATDGTDEIEAFLAGESALLPVQREELGDASGSRLLDLQCSIGTRTLSWAREGATVTGVDISAESVRVAREIADEAGLADRAEFVRSNVYDLPDDHDERYDTLVTNFGVLCWLPDLDRWAAVVAELLEPGGTFYLAEHHPIATALSDDLGAGEDPISVEHPYFSSDAPVSAADGSTHKWIHGLGEIVTALADAGIRIEFVHEHPFSPIRRSPQMVQDDRGRWRFEGDASLPLLVTVKGELRSDAPGA
ncbi:class I SAM-dependent methyltransferase [Halobaculum sp. CBA1158]|uniref:class I SAM-dependent methyltransferase n=1 Tax=Halobaculum sp. CBA1158 TaxID=2904243 RepID=UPI001F29B33F|nr:class I SAM-dependent methyltransferase [Halobaculum sp. CBA1158]UIO99415.1 class I SAM-dependent methyltransferase [Halobaculum sp. CBA1158]